MMGACRVSGREFVPHSTRSTTLPAMAMAEPTEISCPPEAAVTSVMPMARMTSSEALSRMVMRLPVRTRSPRLFSFSVMAKKEGSAMRLNTISSKSAASGMKICFRTRRVRKFPCRFCVVSFMPVHLRRWFS